MNRSLPFEESPKARASLRTGTLYAIDGGDSYIYFGQVDADKSFGFFEVRSKEVLELEEILNYPMMSRFAVAHPSIGRALRAGKWLKLGSSSLVAELSAVPVLIQWPVGTLEVTVWEGAKEVRKTKIHDPEIQNCEVMSVYDAIEHVPTRLQADFLRNKDMWHVGGPVWRHRLLKEGMAQRFPDMPWHALPEDWVHCTDDNLTK